MELPASLDRESGNDNDGGDGGEGAERLHEELRRLTFLPFHVHGDGLEEKSVPHEGDREDEETQHGHRREDGVRFLPNESGAVGDKENDEDDVQRGRECVEVGVFSHVSTIPNLTDASRASTETSFLKSKLYLSDTPTEGAQYG